MAEIDLLRRRAGTSMKQKPAARRHAKRRADAAGAATSS